MTNYTVTPFRPSDDFLVPNPTIDIALYCLTVLFFLDTFLALFYLASWVTSFFGTNGPPTLDFETTNQEFSLSDYTDEPSDYIYNVAERLMVALPEGAAIYGLLQGHVIAVAPYIMLIGALILLKTFYFITSFGEDDITNYTGFHNVDLVASIVILGFQVFALIYSTSYLIIVLKTTYSEFLSQIPFNPFS